MVSIEGLPNPRPDAPHAKRLTVLLDEGSDLSKQSAVQQDGAGGHWNLNTEAKIAPAGWAARRRETLLQLRREVLAVDPAAAPADRAVECGPLPFVLDLPLASPLPCVDLPLPSP